MERFNLKKLLKWLQDPSEINGNNINTVICEASRYFGNKVREYLKDKINEYATNSTNKNIRDLYRGVNDFKRGWLRKTTWLRVPTVLRIGGRTTFLSY
jgi:hypothetical protein